MLICGQTDPQRALKWSMQPQRRSQRARSRGRMVRSLEGVGDGEALAVTRIRFQTQ
jgi:hypothetical protein